MASVNQCTFIGNCGREPEMNVTSDGTPFTRFSLAVNEYSGKDAQGKAKYDTLWLNIVTWRKTAEFVNTYVTKGAPLYVRGRLVVRKYTDKNGVERTTMEVVAEDVQVFAKANGATHAPEASDDGDEFP